MTNDKYIYSHETKSLKQWLEKPKIVYGSVPYHSNVYQSWLMEMDAYQKRVESLPTIQAEGLNLDKDCELVEGKDFELNYVCPACGGDGKETCNNPDHGFIEAMGGETGRLGCPGCGHDPDHKVNRGRNTCPECGGLGCVIPDVFEEYGRETGFDEEPIPIALPIHKEKQQETGDVREKVLQNRIAFLLEELQALKESNERLKAEMNKLERCYIDTHREMERLQSLNP